jgi:DNA-binding response OmpR family regulator
MTATARILIIDDDADSREIMSVVLTHAGHVVGLAANGVEGLEMFGTGENWDLVLLDQMMPGMSGLETLQQLRARDPATRVIMATAYATIDIAVEALRGGAGDFLRKPFTVEVLRGAVQATLARPRPATAPEPTGTGDSFLVNGYRFRRVPLPTTRDDKSNLQVCRAFEVQSPSGETRYCAVDIALLAREMMRVALGQDCSPADPAWDRICENALANYLWEKARIAPETLCVYDLTREQLRMARTALEANPVDHVT